MPFFVMQFPDHVDTHHQLVYSLVCAALVPHCGDNTLYLNHYQKLFGHDQSLFMLNALKTELTQLSQKKYQPASLPELVRTYLTPRLHEQLKTQGRLPMDYIAAFEGLMGVSVVVHESHPGDISDDLIHLLHTENTYSALINLVTLSEAQKTHLNPPQEAVHCLALEGLIQRGCHQVSTQLTVTKEQLPIRSHDHLTAPTLLAPSVNDIHAPKNTLNLRGKESLVHSIKHDAVNVHFNDKEDDWNDLHATGIALGTGLGVGAFALGVELVIEYDFALILGGYIWVGAFPLTLLAVLLGGAVGIHSVQETNHFHQSLRDTLACLELNDVDGAMHILEQDTSKNKVRKVLQWFLLTKEHYAFHHFFHGVCYEIKLNYHDAYLYYNKARHDAKYANRTFMTFLAQFQEIKMLNAIPGSEKTIEIKAELDKTLKEFTENYPVAVSDLYSKLINLIRVLSMACSQPDHRSKSDPKVLKALINDFLQFNDFYLLTHCSKADGAFLILFGQFCQGLLLGFLGNRNTAYLNEDTTKHLRTLVQKTDVNASLKNNELLTFALAKMQSVLKGINDFKNKHRAHIGTDTAIHQALNFMEAYMIEFIMHCDGKASNFNEALRQAKETLGIDEQKTAQIRNGVTYIQGLLTNLQHDFGLTFYSVQTWLQDQGLISMLPITGNTPLHLLVQMPLVQDISREMMIAKLMRLSQYVTTTNDENKTPLAALLKDDPYQLKDELEKEFYYQTALAYQRQQAPNPVQLLTYLQKAADKGCEPALTQITALLDGPLLTAEDWLAVGKLYYKGNEFAKNHQQAMRCFKRAAQLGLATGYYNIGVMYRREEGVKQDLVEASRQYTVAMQKGYGDKNKLRQTHDNLLNDPHFPLSFKKACQKAFEMAYIHSFLNDKNNTVNQPDNDGETLLHRASKQKSYKNCARLILFGSNKGEKNQNRTLAFGGLTHQEHSKITALQNGLTVLKQDLNTPVEELLVRIIKTDTGCIDLNGMRSAIKELSELLDINPLLELAKLASLKLHDTAKRERFEEGYDSDNDNEERMTNDQALLIQISANEDHVNDIFHAGQNGLMGNGCHGVYTQEGNTVYVGGGRDPRKVRGTLIHELTHFLAYEVFKNVCNPYAESSVDLKKQFNDITNRIWLLQKSAFPNELSPIRDVFLYEEDQWHVELIVRVPQIIAANPDNGLRLLGTHVPDLLAYYRNEFLPSLKQHTQVLRTRALSGWDEALFPKPTNPYAFELR